MLDLGKRYKEQRTSASRPLEGQSWVMMFNKASTRTRMSFEVGVHELGGNIIFLSKNDIQLGRGETIEDTARVIGRMAHGAIIRTFEQADVARFAEFSGVPTINALTDQEHPCQIITDVFTFEEKRGPISGKKVVFIGDADNNMGRSWACAAEILGIDMWFAAPEGYQCPVQNGNVRQTTSVAEAAEGADLLYTDVWISMGKEVEAAERERVFAGYQINEKVVAMAKPDVLVQHCLPAYREKEISTETFDRFAMDIFDQSENRLHAQKGILHWLVEG